MNTYKESFYNIVIEKNDDKILIYNTNSTALCWFDIQFYETFNNKEYLEETNLPKELIRNGFVVPTYINEVEKIDIQRQKFIFNDYPEKIRYVIAPTLNCNMHCKYCFENGVKEKNTISSKDLDIMISFIEKQISKNLNLKQLEIVWFGGEPLIALDSIVTLSKAIISVCEEKGIKYTSTLVSNASLLSDDNIKKLKNDCNITSLQCTIDGIEKDYVEIRNVSKEVYATVLSNVKNACNYFEVTIRINITIEGKDDIKKLLDYLFDSGEYKNLKVYFSMIRDYSCNECYATLKKDEFIELRNELELYLCNKGLNKQIKNSIEERRIVSCSSMQINSFAIDPKLNLYRCQHCFGNDKYIIGDCVNGLYNNEFDNEFLNYQILDKCKKCKFYPVCANGCREELIVQKRTIDCEDLKNRIYDKIKLFMKK